MKSICMFALLLMSSRAFAFGAYTAKLVCISARSAATMSYSNAEADGFQFTDDGTQAAVNGSPDDATVISRNNLNTIAIGPSMWTVKQKAGNAKLGFTVRSVSEGKKTPVSLLDLSSDVVVELFDASGKSLGTEQTRC